MQHRLSIDSGRRSLIGAAAALCLLPQAARSQNTFPSKTVTIVVPTTPGGTADILARLFAPRLAKRWGNTPVIVENKPGAGSLIGTELLSRAAPDGHTFMVAFNEIATLPALHPQAKVDVVNGLTRITKLGGLPVVLLAHPSFPADTLAEAHKLFKSAPGEHEYASNGPGAVLHLFTELYRRVADVDILHVPYRGAKEASLALLAGEVDFLVQFASGNVIGYVTTGKAKALAVAGPSRISQLPDVPTAAEAGLPELRLDAWYGVFGPAGMPADLVAEIAAAFKDAVQDPEVIERLKGINFEVDTSTPEAFDSFFRAEVDQWGKLIQEANIRAS